MKLFQIKKWGILCLSIFAFSLFLGNYNFVQASSHNLYSGMTPEEFNKYSGSAYNECKKGSDVMAFSVERFSYTTYLYNLRNFLGFGVNNESIKFSRSNISQNVHHAVCKVRVINTPFNPERKQLVWVTLYECVDLCSGKPPEGVSVTSYDHETEIFYYNNFQRSLVDGILFDPPPPTDCILAPINIYFANGILNNQEEADRSLKKLKIKVEKKLAEKDISNDKSENPSCSNVIFKTLYHDHTIEEGILNTLKDANRPVEDFYDPVVLDQGYSGVVPNFTDPANVVEQVASMDSSRGGQKVTSIIVAHSLGNKVANKVYELSSPVNKPVIIAIGTPESYVADGSSHITNDKDLIINLLAKPIKFARGQEQPLDGNIYTRLDLLDSQHEFAEDYLKEGSAARKAICDRLGLEFSKPGIVGPIP